jgi:hypothetical protein
MDPFLTTLPDPLSIRTACRTVIQRAHWVSLDFSALPTLADRLPHPLPNLPAWDHPLHWRGTPEQTANYVLLLDALNFCFWGEPRWQVEYDGRTYDGYWALAASLRRALDRGLPLWDPHFLSRLTDAEITALFAGQGTIPLLEWRIRHVREIARGLIEHCRGSFATLIAAAGGSSIELVRLVVGTFPSFDDVATYDGQRVPFYKRAQLLCTDLAGAFRGTGLGCFHDLDLLTAFADYKLPQVLRAFGVLRYHPELAARIDARHEIPAGSTEEVEIRAATVLAVDALTLSLRTRGLPAAPWRVDWALWQLGQNLPPDAPPYHRTRSRFY